MIAVAAALDNNIQEKSSGCMPPMEFAQQHNCSLEYSMGNKVASYTCGIWEIQGDCEGGVISYNEQTTPKAVLWLTVFLIILFVVLMIVLIRMLTKKDVEDETEGYY